MNKLKLFLHIKYNINNNKFIIYIYIEFMATKRKKQNNIYVSDPYDGGDETKILKKSLTNTRHVVNDNNSKKSDKVHIILPEIVYDADMFNYLNSFIVPGGVNYVPDGIEEFPLII